MPLTSMINRDNVYAGPGAAQPPAPGILDVARAGYQVQVDNYNTNSRDALIDDERGKRDQLFKEMTGKELEPMLAKEFTWNDPIIAPLQASTPGARQDTYETRQRMEYYKDLHIKSLRASDPNVYGNLKTEEEIREAARGRAKMSMEEFGRLQERSDWKGAVAGFAGQVAGGIKDPLNLGTLAWGAGASILARQTLKAASVTMLRKGVWDTATQAAAESTVKAMGLNAAKLPLGKALVQAAGKEALENVAQEAVTAPVVAKWQEDVGVKYGMSDFIENLAVAGVLGAGFGAGFEGVPRSARYLWNGIKESNLADAASKKAAGIMERVSHIQEAIPFLKGRKGQEIHAKGVHKAAEALEAGKSLGPDEIMPESTFLAQDTNIPEGGSELLKGQAQELARMQEVVVNQTLESEAHLDSLTPARLRELGQASEEGKLWRVHIEKADGTNVVVDAVGTKAEARAQVEAQHLKEGDVTMGVDPVSLKAQERPKGKITKWDGNSGTLEHEGLALTITAKDIEVTPKVGDEVHFDMVEGSPQAISPRKVEAKVTSSADNLAVKKSIDGEISRMIDNGELPKGMSQKQAADALNKGSGKRYETLKTQATKNLEGGGRMADPPEGFQRGEVAWFDDSSGEGMVRAQDGQDYYVHYSAIEAGEMGQKTLTKGQKIDFKLYENAYMKQVDAVREPGWDRTADPEYSKALERGQEFTPERFDAGTADAPDNELAYEVGLELPPSEPRRVQDHYVEMANSETRVKSEQARFKDLLEKEGDTAILMDDGTTKTVRQLAEELEGDDKAFAAMQSCSLV
jgi:CspA family cold shock protein